MVRIIFLGFKEKETGRRSNNGSYYFFGSQRAIDSHSYSGFQFDGGLHYFWVSRRNRLTFLFWFPF